MYTALSFRKFVMRAVIFAALFAALSTWLMLEVDGQAPATTNALLVSADPTPNLRSLYRTETTQCRSEGRGRAECQSRARQQVSAKLRQEAARISSIR